MRLGEPIAHGRTAEIYPLGDDRVLKLYQQGVPRDAVDRELEGAGWAARQGLPVPAPGDVVQIDGRWGLEFERVEGPNGMERIMSEDGRSTAEAFELARLQTMVNACLGGPTPDRRELVLRRIESVEELSATEVHALTGILESLPAGDRLLHGDMHPGNVIWSPAGPMIVDWVDASRGLPVADLARSLVLFRSYSPSLPEDDPRCVFRTQYSDAYRSLTDDPLHRLGDWLLVSAAARLAEGAAEADAELRRFVHEKLSCHPVTRHPTGTRRPSAEP